MSKFAVSISFRLLKDNTVTYNNSVSNSADLKNLVSKSINKFYKLRKRIFD